MLLAMGAVLLGRENSLLLALVLTAAVCMGRGRNVSGVFSAQQEIEQGNRYAICIGDVRISTAAAEKNSERRSFGEDTACAFPCRDGCGTDGAALWALGAWQVNGKSLLLWISGALDGVGRLLGMSGVILTGFLFALPANELAIPVIFVAADAAECAWGCTGG